MTAKEIQTELIKSYLKPKLKIEGYSTSGNTWWKNKGDFFIVINLQNSQWNTKEELSFCFNIGVALTEKLNDPLRKKATYNDIIPQIREDGYLPEERKKHQYRQGGWLGYLINDKTDYKDFLKEFKIDLEENILIKLNSLNTLDDCIRFYDQFKIWGDFLRSRVNELKK